MGRLNCGSVENGEEELVWEGQQALGHRPPPLSAFTLQQALEGGEEERGRRGGGGGEEEEEGGMDGVIL